MTRGVQQDGQELCVTKSVKMEPMVITVSKTVVVTVLMTLTVTNRLVTVTVDVTRDIQTVTVAKNVRPGNLDFPAANVVASNV